MNTSIGEKVLLFIHQTIHVWQEVNVILFSAYPFTLAKLFGLDTIFDHINLTSLAVHTNLPLLLVSSCYWIDTVQIQNCLLIFTINIKTLEIYFLQHIEWSILWALKMSSTWLYWSIREYVYEKIVYWRFPGEQRWKQRRKMPSTKLLDLIIFSWIVWVWYYIVLSVSGTYMYYVTDRRIK